MVSTLSIRNDLAPLFEFLGTTGLILAILAAASAGIAAAAQRADAVGVSTGIWLSGILLSACASYSSGWWLMGASLLAYPAALLITMATRIIVPNELRRFARRISRPLYALSVGTRKDTSSSAAASAPRSARNVESTTRNVMLVRLPGDHGAHRHGRTPDR